MTFLIAALNIILVGSFWIGAGSASHTFTPLLGTMTRFPESMKQI